jgi:RHS repeat-associated protein
MTNDPTAQIRQWTQWHRGLGGSSATQAKKWDFRYDAVDQLTEAMKAPVLGGAMEASLGYGYDPAGNRNQVLENGVAQEFTVNGKNELTGTAATQSAPVRFAGTVSAASTVTLAGQPATMTSNALAWEKTLTLGTGAQSLELLATETAPPPGKPAETTRRHVNLTLTAAPAASFAYDENGSLLSTIRNPQSAISYEWDAANRLSAIVKDGQRTEFTYDGQSRWTRIVERDGPTTAAPVLSIRRFVWEGYTIAQIRDYDASDTLTGVRHVFGEGEVRTTSLAQSLASGTSLLHLRDHLGSVRELVNAGDLDMRARYDFAPYGQRTKLAGDLDSDFGFTGHYEHAASGLTLAPFRAYDSALGRWLSRDPIEESGGMNLYGYVGGTPVSLVDPDGAAPAEWAESFDSASTSAEAELIANPHAWVRNGAVSTVSQMARGFVDMFRFGEGMATGDGWADVRRGAGIVLTVTGPLSGAGRGACNSPKPVTINASSALQGARLREHLAQLEKYGTQGFKELENGTIRYYGKLKPATTPGELSGLLRLA